MKIGTLFIGLLVLCSCNKDLDGDVEIKIDETISDKEISLEFTAFTDSRCPIGSVCIWTGDYSADFNFVGPNSTTEFTLHQTSPVDTVVDGYQIILKGLTPHPTNEGEINNSEKRAQVEIKKL